MTIPVVGMTKKDREEEEEKTYKEAFDYFDWNKSRTIPTSVSRES